MKYLPLLASLLIYGSFGFAGEKTQKMKESINEGAEKIDQGTRNVIKKSKEKLKQREEKKEAEKKSEGNP